MLKVLLIRPRPHNETIGLQHVMICEPLELEYLVSNVPEEIKNQVHIKIYDLIVEKQGYKDILLENKPDFVLFTGYITHVGIVKEMSRTAKEMLPGICTGVGGVHAEVVPDDFNSEYIDFIYSKNGIDGFNTTLSMLLNGNNAIQINKEINQAAKNSSFNYRHPDRSAVSKYRRHYYYMFHSPCALIKTSFGCPYNCSFCFCKEITDGKYFSRDMEDVLDELQTIEEEEIYIVDDDFLFNTKKLREFIDGIQSRNIKKKFLVYGRADFIVENKGLISELKHIGLQAVIVGIESVRSKDLQAYNKKTTKDINEGCIKVLRALDIELYATLIIPLDFTVADFNELTAWIKSLNVRFVNLQPLTPLPGTDIFDSYTSDLLVKREDYEVWDMAHVVLKPEFMSIRKFYAQLLKAYYKVIMRPKHMVFLIRKYGFKSNLKMLAGSSLVSMQYMKKIVRGR
ncbi:B12-binding domain-containing radical SAM protein [Sedimentibacter sp.]|uniref:B12-binding domain-containing radical SAM protein n=1 Tax=Sedimentibacter sp. TaxID=1960295 RepID=UPI00289C1CCE|nr:radical SAM protein [Sedimentibacter sp.]